MTDNPHLRAARGEYDDPPHEDKRVPFFVGLLNGVMYTLGGAALVVYIVVAWFS